MLVSVVVTTYNRSVVLRRALTFLLRQSYRNFEILVCDDNSTDDTEKVVNNFSLLRPIKYFNTGSSAEVFGACKARNLGIQNAQGQVILFIDDDILLHREAVAEHVKLFEQRKWRINSIGYVSGNKKELFIQIPIEPTNYKWVERVARVRAKADFGKEWRRGSCVNTAYSRKDLLRVGGWDEQFTKYGYEEKDLNYRLYKERKIEFLLNLNAIAVHVGGGHDFLTKKKKREDAREMVQLLYKKHPELK